jgi:hypothetical protein
MKEKSMRLVQIAQNFIYNVCICTHKDLYVNSIIEINKHLYWQRHKHHLVISQTLNTLWPSLYIPRFNYIQSNKYFLLNQNTTKAFEKLWNFANNALQILQEIKRKFSPCNNFLIIFATWMGKRVLKSVSISLSVN